MSLFGRAASLKRRVVTRLKDRAKFSSAASETVAAISLARAWFDAPNPDYAIKAYQRTKLGAIRRSALQKMRERMASSLVSDEQLAIRWSRYLASSELTRSILLKPPGTDGERGVLLLTAEYNWVKLLTARQFPQIAPRFTVLLSAGWSPLDYALIGLALRRVSGTVFVEPGNYGEVSRIEAIDPRVRCLPTICSDWINPALFNPKPRDQRGTDLLMVANWAPFKRHWHLFSALKRMPPDLRVTLIGQPDGPFTAERVRLQARDFGAPQNIRYLENLRVEQVYDAMCDSRALVLLSRQEGPCVAVTEALLADTPVAMLRDAHVGTRAYINDQTGTLLDHGRLVEQLSELLAGSPTLRPREWAMRNVSCHASLAKWNQFLSARAKEVGEPWTKDLLPFCWKPYTTYLRTEDRVTVEQTFRELRAIAPAVFGPAFLPDAVVPLTGDVT